jgi:adenylosuccinate lyase
LAEALLSSEVIRAKLQQHEIEAALDPHRYLGECDSVIDAVIAAARKSGLAPE